MLSVYAARDLTHSVSLEWSKCDVERLAPLVDATLVWAEDDVLAAIATPIIQTMWQEELRDDIENALVSTVERSVHVRALLTHARADLDTGPRHSLVARAFVQQAAVEAAFGEHLPICCVLCLDELIAAVPNDERRDIALRVGRIATRAAAVPDGELQAALGTAAFVLGQSDVALALATDERRQAVRAWVGRLGELGARSVPALATELSRVAVEPLPAPDEDDLWRETVAGLIDLRSDAWN